MMNQTIECSEEIIENVRRFLPSWKDIETKDITISPFSGGYVNTLWLVSSKEDKNAKPSSILYRTYGGNFLPREILKMWSCLLSETEEVMVAYEHGRRGWGPQVFGVFPGGRIEEYIPSTVLLPKSATDLQISLDIARAYARFHSMDIPIEKDRLEQLGRDYKSQSNSYFKDFDPDFPFETPVSLEEILKFPLLDELDWVSLVTKEITCKKVFLTLDTNYNNILVRNVVERDQLKVVLVDYEVAVYGSRGIDLGGHFACRIVDKKDETCEEKGLKPSDIEYPNEHFRRAFVREYLQEWKSVGKFDPEVDNEEHLLMECDLGSLTYALYRINFTIKMCDLLRHPNMFFLLPLFISFYQKHKKYFVSKYKWKSILPQDRNCWLPIGIRNQR
jgi:choline/ethanolamine kinase